MKLVVGLGNPGEDYRGTRHNLGFMVVEELARRYRVEKHEYKHNAVIAWVRIHGEPVALIKPLTFMNLSGAAVRPLLAGLKAGTGELLVVYDDMDLEPGRIRLRAGGGAGGHRGLASIMEKLGTSNFNRLRIGIGHPPKGSDAIGHVLGRFSTEEEPVMTGAVAKAADAVEVWVKAGIVKAMNSYN